MMERDEIIRLAKEATGNDPVYCRQEFTFSQKQLERLAHLVAAEYKRDALRYRWLKENIRGGSIGTPIGWFDDDVSDWDEDIDKAMEQTK